MKTLWNSENLTFIQGVLFVFEMLKIAGLKNFSKFTGKHYRQALQALVQKFMSTSEQTLWAWRPPTAPTLSKRDSNTDVFLRISKTFINTFSNKLQHFTLWLSYLTILTILVVCRIFRFEKEYLSESQKVIRFLIF